MMRQLNLATPGKCTGIALITVLWVTALMAIVVGSLSSTIRTESTMVGSLVKVSAAKNAAIGGVYLASYHLMQMSPESRWSGDGSINEKPIGQALVRMSIVDEAGKLDLNFVQLDVLRNLLIAADVDSERVDMIADAILDWRDADEFTRLNGAEDRDYEMAGYPYGAKDSLFESIDELQLVMGVDQVLYSKLKDSVTVYSKRSDINPQVASRYVLLAITNNDVDSVDSYISLRNANRLTGLPPPPAPMLAKSHLSAAGGKVYTIYSEAKIEGDVYSRVSSTLSTHRNIPATPIDFIVWRDSGIQLFERITLNENTPQGI